MKDPELWVAVTIIAVVIVVLGMAAGYFID